MPTSKNVSIVAAPDTPENLALSDLALNAAIELERFQRNSDCSLEALGALSDALSQRGLTDLTLVPVYDRALASGIGHAAASKNDLHSRLRNIVAKLQSSGKPSPNDLDALKDFCVALHDALLTNRTQPIRDPVLGQRR